MDPRWLMPVLSVLFAAMAVRQWLRSGARHPALRSWVLLALIFGAVSLFLHQAV
jgi:DMSO reductase anchor subunit